MSSDISARGVSDKLRFGDEKCFECDWLESRNGVRMRQKLKAIRSHRTRDTGMCFARQEGPRAALNE